MANLLIVGANQGIGYYLVERLLELGNTVTVLDIQINTIEILREKYQKTLLPIIADARELSSIRRVYRKWRHMSMNIKKSSTVFLGGTIVVCLLQGIEL